MERVSIWVLMVTSFFLLNNINMINCVEEEVKRTLIQFVTKLSSNTLVWKLDSDPCKDNWEGVYCDDNDVEIKWLYLNNMNLSGTLDVAMICNSQPLAASLTFLTLDGNNIGGGISSEIGNCRQLTRLHLGRNQLAGNIPASLATLNNLKRLDISNNKFSGPLPDLSRISGLNMLLAQNNNLSGNIPAFDFSNFDQFNVSFNNLTGEIPAGHVFADSFLGNPGLCGVPLNKNCSSQTLNATGSASENETSSSKKSNSNSNDQILMYSGYAVLGAVVILLVALKLCKSRNKKGKKIEAIDSGKSIQSSYVLSESKAAEGFRSATRNNKSEHSESGIVSVLMSQSQSQSQSHSQSQLVVLSRPEVNELKLEELLRAPAELIGRGEKASLYKVILTNGLTVVVKRIKDWRISSLHFNQRMQLLSQAKHPHVLSPLAFYASKQEKLLVYQYQHNGSLFKHLHGSSNTFDWTSRLEAAATIAEALAFMHQELGQHGIIHGNLKSSNILLNNNMEPCISEYGAMSKDDDKQKQHIASDVFKGDVYGFGVILLELLTGKLVKNNGIDITDWVQSVVREEWTGEVFDRSLLSDYPSEERMVNLLQVAIKCVNSSPEVRPNMNQVLLMINTIRDDEEKSLIYQV